MREKDPRKVYNECKSHLPVNSVFGVIGLLFLWFLPGISWLGWIIFGLSVLSIVGDVTTMLMMRKRF